MPATEQAPLTYAAPALATIGAASTVVVAASNTRELLVLVNNSDSDMYLGLGADAESTKGLCLKASGGVVQFGGASGLPLWRGAVNAIAGGAGKVLSVQEATV